MRIVFSNREWYFLRHFLTSRLRTNVQIARYISRLTRTSLFLPCLLFDLGNQGLCFTLMTNLEVGPCFAKICFLVTDKNSR